MFLQNWLLQMFQVWLLFSCHMFHQNRLLQMFRVWLLFHVICFIKTGCFNVCSTVALEVVFNNQQIRQRMQPLPGSWWNCLMELLICLICEIWSLILRWSVIFSESDLLIFDLWSVLKNWSAVIFDLLICRVHDLRPVWKVIFWSWIFDLWSSELFDLSSQKTEPG